MAVHDENNPTPTDSAARCRVIADSEKCGAVDTLDFGTLNDGDLKNRVFANRSPGAEAFNLVLRALESENISTDTDEVPITIDAHSARAFTLTAICTKSFNAENTGFTIELSIESTLIAELQAACSDCSDVYKDCDEDAVTNGCETNTQNSVDHGGGCHNPCAFENSTAQGVGGECQIQACDEGFDHCAQDASNGDKRSQSTLDNGMADDDGVGAPEVFGGFTVDGCPDLIGQGDIGGAGGGGADDPSDGIFTYGDANTMTADTSGKAGPQWGAGSNDDAQKHPQSLLLSGSPFGKGAIVDQPAVCDPQQAHAVFNTL